MTEMTADRTASLSKSSTTVAFTMIFDSGSLLFASSSSTLIVMAMLVAVKAALTMSAVGNRVPEERCELVAEEEGHRDT